MSKLIEIISKSGNGPGSERNKSKEGSRSESPRKQSKRLSKMLTFNSSKAYSGFGIKDLDYVLGETKSMIKRVKFWGESKSIKLNFFLFDY